ncbi:MAG: methyltransferase [Cyanobacteria bacterium P01_F01_bin.3]
MNNELTFDELALIAGGHSAFQLLWAGVSLGVFDRLSEQPDMTLSQLAEILELEEQPARILLSGLATLKLLVKSEDSFRNCDIVEQVFVRSSEGNMVDVLGWQAHITYPAQVDFLESLRRNTNVGLRHFPGEGNDLYHRLAYNPDLEQVFHDAMSSLSRSANSVLCDQADFTGVNHLVDAGGGNGENAIALARANPHLRITIFDAPTVCELAEKNAAEAGLSDRVKTHPGDFFVDDFPDDIDAIIFAHMLTIWSLPRNTELLKRCRDALPIGGQLFIFNMMANDNDVGPVAATLGSPYFLTIATGEGMLYSWRDYEKCLADAGFAQTNRHELPRNHGLLVGLK